MLDKLLWIGMVRSACGGKISIQVCWWITNKYYKLLYFSFLVFLSTFFFLQQFCLGFTFLSHHKIVAWNSHRCKNKTGHHWVHTAHMWCGQGKWVLCRALSNFRFAIYLVEQPESFVLLKTSSKLDLQFKRYKEFVQLKTIRYKRNFIQ